MSLEANILKNNGLAGAAGNAAAGVVSAIRTASARTGVDFAYLVQQAGAESSFNPLAKAATSSATGLYQFIERTWLSMVKNHGDKYGLGDYAAKIDAKGRVADKALRREILDLRKDPAVASFMAAEFASENKAYLQRHVGGKIGSTELYFAHFLGAPKAAAFLKELRHNPMAAAADLFPKEALANRNVFYDSKTGQPRSLQAVHDFFGRKFSAPLPAMMVADAGGAAHDVPLPASKPSAEEPSDADLATLYLRGGVPWKEDAAEEPYQLSSHIGSPPPEGWHIFPPSLYNRAPLSPSALLLLSSTNF